MLDVPLRASFHMLTAVDVLRQLHATVFPDFGTDPVQSNSSWGVRGLVDQCETYQSGNFRKVRERYISKWKVEKPMLDMRNHGEAK